jgi:hypothetical protein
MYKIVVEFLATYQSIECALSYIVENSLGDWNAQNDG